MQNIPTGLQALMQASAVLQNTAAPTAPGPQGQQPTVANRVMQQGMAQAGKQAGIANAMMMQKAQQQQRMAQDPQAVAQMAAQMLKQGVGGLPVNMQFKDGGIIGFDDGGTVRAGVRKTPSPQFDKENQQLILEYLKQLGDMKLMAGLAMQEGNPTIAQLLASKGLGTEKFHLGQWVRPVICNRSWLDTPTSSWRTGWCKRNHPEVFTERSAVRFVLQQTVCGRWDHWIPTGRRSGPSR